MSKNITTKSKNATKIRKNATRMLLMLAFFFKNPLSGKNAFLMPAQLPDPYSGGNKIYGF